MEGMRTASERENLHVMGDKQAQHGLRCGTCGEVGSNEYGDEISQGALAELPGVCLATILSWLPPREVAKVACVCRSFHAASGFDSVWDNILPPKYEEFLARDPDALPEQFASKREIFDHLCHPTISENNTQAFWIDRGTGGVCLSSAARALHITWGDDYRYWDWIPDENSLYPEIARLINVCWFEARGEMECSLPPGAYTFTWRLYLADLHGWNTEPAHFTLSKNDVENFECKSYIDPRPDVASRPVGQFRLPTFRLTETGWTEYDVGEFFVENGETNSTLKFSMNAIHRGAWKSGLHLDGVMVRPTETVRRIQPVTTSTADQSGFRTPEFQPEGPDLQAPQGLRRFFASLSRSWPR